MDFQDTSSVAKLASMRILVFLAITHHWLLHQLDVTNAFLNGVLDEEVKHGATTQFCCSGGVKEGVQAEKSLYGLK